MKNFTILYVEDEDGIREGLSEFLENFSDIVILAENGQKGLNLYSQHKIDMVISDISMPIMTGIEMAKQIKKINPEQCILFITAHNNDKHRLAATNMKVKNFILKPIDFDELEGILNLKMDKLKKIRGK